MQRLLTDFELMAMLAVLRVREEAYGVPIAQELEAAGRRVTLGAVYLALDRLEGQGLLASTLGDATAQRGGRAKRYFRVTASGLRAVRTTQRAFMTMWQNIPELDGGRA